jgi:integral membrane sensor domain MASE1
MAYVQINVSPVWPPPVSLVALLIFGYNLWPGISLELLGCSSQVQSLGRRDNWVPKHWRAIC